MLFHFAITAATVIVLLSQSDGVSGSSTSEFPDPGATPVPSAGPPQLPGYGPDVDPSTLLSPGNNITLVAQMLDGPTDEFIQTFGNLSSTQYLMDDGNSGFSLSNDSTQATVFLQGLQQRSHLNWTRFGVGGQPCVLGLVVGDGRPAESSFAWPQHYGSLTNVPQVNLRNGASPWYSFYGGSQATVMIDWQFDSNGVLSDSNGTVPPWLGCWSMYEERRNSTPIPLSYVLANAAGSHDPAYQCRKIRIVKNQVNATA